MNTDFIMCKNCTISYPITSAHNCMADLLKRLIALDKKEKDNKFLIKQYEKAFGELENYYSSGRYESEDRYNQLNVAYKDLTMQHQEDMNNMTADLDALKDENTTLREENERLTKSINNYKKEREVYMRRDEKPRSNL